MGRHEKKDLREIFRRAWREADPAGLIDMGAPADEYDSEAERHFHLARTRRAATEEDLARLAAEVFDRMFRVRGCTETWEMSDKTAREIARRIMESLPR